MKRYDEEFQKDAVEMLMNGTRSLRKLARELGVSPQTLRNWKDVYLEKKANQFSKDIANIKQTYEELRKLKIENATLKRQQKILKKALSILSEPPEESMC
ncbi:MAG: transposase [Candidatus Ratteibacteria bacterium]